MMNNECVLEYNMQSINNLMIANARGLGSVRGQKWMRKPEYQEWEGALWVTSRTSTWKDNDRTNVRCM